MSAPTTERSVLRRYAPPIIVAVVVLGSLATFIWNAVETSTARVNATTSANSVFSAGTVDLAQPFTTVELLFDANNLYPGNVLDGCVEVDYRGSLTADVRLHGRMLGGTGLDEFVDVRVTLPDVETCDEVGDERGRPLFVGTLGDFWRRHDSYGDGVALAKMATGDRGILHVSATLQDDNAAQGLTTDFALTVEARP